MTFELSEAKINKITTFIQDEMLDNAEWDALIQQFRVLVETPVGKKFVKQALDLLTLQHEVDDFTQNCEVVAAALALGFTRPNPFYHALIEHCPRLKNKSAIEQLMIQMSKFTEVPLGEPQICPHCTTPCIETDKFCRQCGTAITMASAPDQQQADTLAGLASPMLESFTSIISVMDEHTKLLRKLNSKGKKSFFSGARDDYEENLDEPGEEEDTTTPSVWREAICSNKECSYIIQQHEFALQQYIERSMVTVAQIIQQMKTMGNHLSKETRVDMMHKLSQSLRDQLQSYHMPGARPLETEKKALCCSMLKGRLPARELEKVAAHKPKYIPPKEIKDKDMKKTDSVKDATGRDGGKKDK